jgi:outer membrane protein
MNQKFALLAALAAGLLPVAAVAQASPAASQPAPPAASVPAPAAAQPSRLAPTAYPAKVALIEFEQAVIATNEGQRTLAEVQKKYEPKKAQLDALATEIDSLKKQLQAAPATLSDEERASRLKTIDTKDKQYQRDAEDASTAYNQDVQEALGKVSQKVYVVMQKYVQENGFTLLLNVGGQDSPIMWTAQNPNADISEAVIQAYNASSGVTAPPPSAPSATRPRPSTTTPHPATKPQ